VQFNRVVPSVAKQEWVFNGVESVPLFLKTINLNYFRSISYAARVKGWEFKLRIDGFRLECPGIVSKSGAKRDVLSIKCT